MFKNIEEGLEVYKKELREYLQKIEEYKKIYGTDLAPIRNWDDADYEWAQRNTVKLQGIERVLGLSEEEIKRIEGEIKSSL